MTRYLRLYQHTKASFASTLGSAKYQSAAADSAQRSVDIRHRVHACIQFPRGKVRHQDHLLPSHYNDPRYNSRNRNQRGEPQYCNRKYACISRSRQVFVGAIFLCFSCQCVELFTSPEVLCNVTSISSMCCRYLNTLGGHN
jgi:hypothetical protein